MIERGHLQTSFEHLEAARLYSELRVEGETKGWHERSTKIRAVLAAFDRLTPRRECE
jgi:hypothetical protein